MKPLIILNFHGIGVPHDGVPTDERPYWLSTSHFVQVLDKVVEYRDAGYEIEITFDDGNKSDLEIATPLLVQRGLRAAFFVLLGRLVDPHYLSAEDIRALQNEGMEIGLHGRHHLNWRSLEKEDLMDETRIAAKDLSEITGSASEKVAIPFGSYNRNVIAHLKRMHFRKILTSDSGVARLHDQIQARTSLRADTTMEQLDAVVNNRYGIKTRLRRRLSKFVRQNIV